MSLAPSVTSYSFDAVYCAEEISPLTHIICLAKSRCWTEKKFKCYLNKIFHLRRAHPISQLLCEGTSSETMMKSSRQWMKKRRKKKLPTEMFWEEKFFFLQPIFPNTRREVFYFFSFCNNSKNVLGRKNNCCFPWHSLLKHLMFTFLILFHLEVFQIISPVFVRLLAEA